MMEQIPIDDPDLYEDVVEDEWHEEEDDGIDNLVEFIETNAIEDDDLGE